MLKDASNGSVFNNDVDQALRVLRTRMGTARKLAILKQRALYPNRSARRRARVKYNEYKKRKKKHP